MKKVLFTIVMVLLPMLASAAVEVDGIYYNLDSEKKIAEVIKNPDNYYKGDVTIPKNFEYDNITYSVTSIGKEAFHYCMSLTSITIPNSVTSIGENAFYYCSGLTSIKVESGNTKYDSRDNCNAIIETTSNTLIAGCQNTTIPDGVTSIGDNAFYQCSGLTSISIPGSVTSIGNSAFNYCSGLTSINIPGGVTKIGDSAFWYCSALTSVIIPSSVTNIGIGAFAGCSGLASIKVESGNTKFDSRDNCKAIIEKETNTLIAGCNNTTIPGSVTRIGDYAFYYCSSLTSVNIPDGVTSIGERAFYYCSSLTSVKIPDGVTSIEDYTFSGCSALTSISIPGSVTSIGKAAFAYCSSQTSITIPDGVTSIGDNAFYRCRGLTSISIPGSMKSIGEFAFSWCSSLKNAYCYAEKVPTTNSNAFDDANVAHATLHVPKSSLNAYETTSPWKNFKEIVELEGGTGEWAEGDLNHDGKVDAADVVTLVNIIAGKKGE